VWWSEVEHDGSESEKEYFLPWRGMIQWFRGQPEFVDSAFVRIGDREALSDLPRGRKALRSQDVYYLAWLWDSLSVVV
jgi:hypothetical protein